MSLCPIDNLPCVDCTEYCGHFPRKEVLKRCDYCGSAVRDEPCPCRIEADDLDWLYDQEQRSANEH